MARSSAMGSCSRRPAQASMGAEPAVVCRHADPGEVESMPTVSDRATAHLTRAASVAARHRWTTISLALLLTAIFLFGVTRLERDESFEGWLGDEGSLHPAMEGFREAFGNNDYVVVVLRADDVFSSDALRAIRELGRALETEVPYVCSVTSLTNVVVAELGRWGVQPRPVVPGEIPEDAAGLSAIRSLALSEPFYVNRLFSEDAREAAILLRLNAYPEDGEPEAMHQERVAEAVWRILERDRFCEFEPVAGGMPILNTERGPWMNRESLRLAGFALLAMVVLLAVLFRSARCVVVPLATAALSMLWVLGVMGFTGVKIQSVVEVVPLVLVLVMSIGYSIHVLTFYRRGLSTGGVRADAAVWAIERSGWPILLTMVTTVLALASFAVVRVAAVRWLGLVSAALVACTFPLTLFLTTALLSIGRDRAGVTPSSGGDDGERRAALGGLSQWVSGHGRSILAVFALLVLVFATLGTGLDVTTDSLRTVGRRVPYVENAYRISEGLGSLYAYDVTVEFAEDGEAKLPENLRSLDVLADELALEPYVKRTSSITWFVKHLHRAAAGGREDSYTVPDDAATLERLLSLYEASGANEQERWVDPDYGVLRLNVELERFSTDEILPDIRDLTDRAEELFPGADVRLTGVAVQLALVVDYIVRGQILSFLVALLFVGAVMVVALRSVKVGLVAMVPNVAPVVFVVGTMAALDIPLHQATAVVAPMLLGIAVDDTIHYVTHFRSAFQRTGRYEDAARDTMHTVGRAIVTTSIVVAIGFAVLLTSAANAYRHVGLVTIVGVVAALLSDLLVTPTLLRITKAFGPEGGGRAS